MQPLKYFCEDEFARCSPPCKLSQMDSHFMDMLDLARDYADTPFIVNSAFRSKDYELSKGRKGTSSHCKGLAVDLHCNNSYQRYLILDALLYVGFRRIGVYKTFIHVDNDDDKISCIWLSESDTFASGG